MHKVGHTEQNPGKLQCLGLQVSTRATLQAILYPKNFLYLFDRLTDEDMAVMDSLVSIVVSCIQLPQNVGGICPQEYRNSF